jgi:hypothetical protein
MKSEKERIEASKAKLTPEEIELGVDPEKLLSSIKDAARKGNHRARKWLQKRGVSYE